MAFKKYLTSGFQMNLQRKVYSISSSSGKHLKGAHAAVVTTIARRPVPFLVTTAAATEQLTLTSN